LSSNSCHTVHRVELGANLNRASIELVRLIVQFGDLSVHDRACSSGGNGAYREQIIERTASLLDISPELAIDVLRGSVKATCQGTALCMQLTAAQATLLPARST
jgi:hypothetical protein